MRARPMIHRAVGATGLPRLRGGRTCHTCFQSPGRWQESRRASALGADYPVNLGGLDGDAFRWRRHDYVRVGGFPWQDRGERIVEKHKHAPGLLGDDLLLRDAHGFRCYHLLSHTMTWHPKTWCSAKLPPMDPSARFPRAWHGLAQYLITPTTLEPSRVESPPNRIETSRGRIRPPR